MIPQDYHSERAFFLNMSFLQYRKFKLMMKLYEGENSLILFMNNLEKMQQKKLQESSMLKCIVCNPLNLCTGIYYQLCEYLENFLSELFCGFQKAHSTQHATFKLYSFS